MPPAETGEPFTGWGQGHLDNHSCVLPVHHTKSLPAPEFTLLIVVFHCYITFSERVGRLQLQVLYASTFKCILTWSDNVTLVLVPISHLFG